MDTTSELKKQSQRDVAELLYSNSFSSIAMNLIAATGLVFTFESTLTAEIKQIWWLVFIAVLCFRLVDTLIWKKQARALNYNSSTAIYRFSISILSTCMLWAIYCVSILNHIEFFELTLMIVIASSMAGGATTILAAHKTVSITYSFIMLIPLSIALSLADEKFMNVIGMLGFAFFIVLSFSAKKTSDFTKQAILWKNQNRILVNNMEEEVSIRTKRIHELSNIDPLTGLHNRSAFLFDVAQRIQADSDKERSFALLFIDLDGFKKINDSLGHVVGDSILKLTAQRLLDLRPAEGILCRWGGDEFLLVVDHIDKDKTQIFAENVINSISEIYLVDNNYLNLSATIGIAIFPEHAKKATLLIQWADMAMYAKKRHAPSTVGFFDEKLREQIQQEIRLKDSLSEALNNDELYLVFQPIVDASSHSLISFEALIRWKHDGRIISPVEFIPIAEQYGQIIKIGHWVLRQACFIATTWPQSIAVSVNVSVMQLQEDSFIASIEAVLMESKLAPQRLHIEITESVFAQDKNSIIHRVKSLQRLGIAVYIDDFGTEYSSLSIIQELSANVVKIDKVFIDKLETNGFSIVKAILHIARALSYKVVAEGVEHKTQADILRHLGVDYLQGYYFSKPIELMVLDQYIASKINMPDTIKVAKIVNTCS